MKKMLLVTNDPIAQMGWSSVLDKKYTLAHAFACNEIMEVNETADLVLIDQSSGINIHTLNQLRKVIAQRKPTPFILWGEQITTEFCYQAMRSGFRGVVRKNYSIPQQLRCLERANNGEFLIEKEIGERLANAAIVRLTPRLSQITALMTAGEDTPDIALRLGVKFRSLRVFLSEIYRDLGVRGHLDLIKIGNRNMGSITPDEAQQVTNLHMVTDKSRESSSVSIEDFLMTQRTLQSLPQLKQFIQDRVSA